MRHVLTGFLFPLFFQILPKAWLDEASQGKGCQHVFHTMDDMTQAVLNGEKYGRSPKSCEPLNRALSTGRGL